MRVNLFQNACKAKMRHREMKSLRRDPKAAEQVYSNFFNDLRHLILSIIFQLGQLNEEQTFSAFTAYFGNSLTVL